MLSLVTETIPKVTHPSHTPVIPGLGASFCPCASGLPAIKRGIFWSSHVLISSSAQESKERMDLAGKKVLGPREKGDGEERWG